MSLPLEICIEELDATHRTAPYVRCVALPGGEPGLALDREGAVRWMPDAPSGRLYGLWVSDDERLVLLRGDAAGPITVERAGRQVEAPGGRPVMLMDQDLLWVDGRRLRVHIHGEAEQIHAPERLAALGRVVRATAAVLALGGMVGPATSEARAAIGPKPIEVRSAPPKMARTRTVDCTIGVMKRTKQGLLVHATCPRDEMIPMGALGRILDPGTNAPLKDGGVRVKSVKGTKVVCEAAQLKQPVKATTLRFQLY